MIDFHSHILPGIDDGSPSIEASLQMLSACKTSGVDTVLMTPHCHPMSQEKVDRFIRRRDNSFSALSKAIEMQGTDLPKIIPAAEIRIYNGLHKFSGLDKLCIKGTEYILLEMPYEVWKDYAFEEIYQLSRLGFKPLMAHLDRFLDQEQSFGEIFSLDVDVQINSSAFIDVPTRKKMIKFFEMGHIQVLGSDAHNITDRPPDVAAAYEIIKKKFGKEYTDYIDTSGESLLKNEEIQPSRFSEMGTFKKMFI